MSDEGYSQARKVEDDVAGAYLAGGSAYALGKMKPGDMSGTVWDALRTSPATKALAGLVVGGAALEGARRLFWHTQDEPAMPVNSSILGIPVGFAAARLIKSPAIAAPLAAALTVAANRLIPGMSNDRVHQDQREILNRFAEGKTSPLSF
jgi:hypothetical protein